LARTLTEMGHGLFYEDLTTYTGALRDMVAKIQERAGLPVTGLMDKNT